MFNDLPPGFRVVSAPEPQAQPARAQAPVSDVPPGFRVVSSPQPSAVPAGPRAEDRNFAQRTFTDPLGQGWNQLQQSVSSGAYQAGLMSPEDYAAALVRDRQDMAQYPVQPEMQRRVQHIAESEGVMQGLGRGLMDPAAVWNVTLQSLPNMIPSLAGGVAGAVAGAPLGPVGVFAGRAAGSGAASAVTEYGNVVSEMIQERGGEVTEENILLALQDEALMAEADRRGKARGAGIGIWDAISFGIAGRTLGPVSKVAGKPAGVGAELGVQAAAEGAGEATAQVFDTGGVDKPGEVALEALAGGLTGAVVEIPTAVLTDRAAQPRGPDAQQSVQPPPAQPAGPGVPPAAPPAGAAPVGADGVAGAPPAPSGQPVEGSEGAARAGGGSPPDPSTGAPGAVPATPPVAQGQGEPAPAPPSPRRREVTYGDNQKIETDFELVELDTLVAASGELQPRDRTRDTSDEQIAQIAGNLDPSRLMESAEADRGAPIVGPDNVIESGNGRIQALRRAMEQFPEKYGEYLDAILESGLAEANPNLKRPVLVRRRVTPLDDTQRRDFVVGANRPATLAMSATERAKADRDALSDDVLDRLVPDASAGLRAASNRDFVRAFVSKLPQTERGSLLDANGQLSQEGERRLQGAILTRAYGDDGTVAQQLEATDDNAKAISGALLDVAGAWAQLVRAVKSGDVKPEFDATKDLMRAVAIVRQARESGEKVLDLVNQGDAFDPVSDATRELVRSFFRDDALTKAAGRARVAEALTRYVKEAQQQTSGANLLGETAPTVTPADVARVARSPKQTSMFGGEETSSQPSQQAAEDAPLFDESDPFADVDADTDDKRGLGGLGPNMARVSQTNRGSNFENAFVAMGENPDEMRARPAGEQIARLIKFVQDTFGFASVARRGPQGEALAVDARDSLLDLYRNGQFMSHVLALPQKGLGLLNTLSINFERDKSRYFGAYYPGEKMIALPGRTNSFAHEWMHALDHFLNEKLNARPEMLSQLAKDEGLDTAKTLEGAFVNVLNALFFDQAAVAQRMLTLQAEASEIATRGPNKGKPTQKALNAQEQIEKLAKGNSHIKGADSKYAQRVKDFSDGNPYWTNPAEMIARAFEAYVAMKVEADGGSNEVITKGNEAYLSDADARLRDTFPKNDDRNNIFRAFDGLFDVLRDAEILGVGVAPKPDDHGTLQPNQWAKQAAAQKDPSLLARLKSEGSRLINLLTLDRGTREEFMAEFRDRAGISDREANPRLPLAVRGMDKARALYWSARSMMHAAAERNGPAGAWGKEFVVDKLATDPGRGRFIDRTFEEAVEQEAKRGNNELQAALKASDIDASRRSDEQVERLRRLALGDPKSAVKGATDAEVKLAAAIRRIFDRLYRENQAAGLDHGFVGETIGYLSRSIQNERVFDNPVQFEAQAKKVYEIVFDRDVGDPVDADALAAKLKAIPQNARSQELTAAVQRMRDLRKKINALSKQMAKSTDPDQIQAKIDALIPDLDDATAEVAELARDAWSDGAAKDWLERVQLGTPMDFETRGPAGKFMQARTMPDEADRLMQDFYIKDPVDALVDYIQNASRKREFVRRFGQVQGNDKLDRIITRNQKAIDRSPRYDANTPEGRKAILRDFGDTSQDSITEIALREMVREGGNPEDARMLRGYLEALTGRSARDPIGAIGALSNTVYALGTLSLLPRATWASIAEPIAVYLRTGSGKAAVTTFAALVREAFVNSKSTRETRAMAELIGLTTSALYETVLMNRLSMNYGDSPALQKLLANFFRRTGLTQLTNAQRRATMVGGWVFVRQLAEAAQGTDTRQMILAQRELAELGVSQENVYDFATFVLNNEKLPALDDMGTPAGQIAATVLNRLVDTIIQNPKRVDKPIYTGTPIGRMAYGIMSFSYSFFRNTVLRAANSADTRRKVNEQVGMSKVGAAAEAYASVGLKFATGAAALTLGQMLVSMAREAIFNGDKWEEKEKKDELAPWLLQLGFSRTGLIGPADVLLQAYTGMRYQRDLTNLYAGPHIGYFMGQAAKIAGVVGPNNSPNSNTAEWNATKAGYQMFAVPALSMLLTALPGGPVTGPLAGMALQGTTSNKAADTFATALVGEKDTRRDP